MTTPRRVLDNARAVCVVSVDVVVVVKVAVGSTTTFVETCGVDVVEVADEAVGEAVAEATEAARAAEVKGI